MGTSLRALVPAGNPVGTSPSDAVKSRVRLPLPARKSAGVVASLAGTVATITCLSCGMYE